jgi:hypothetical protein
MLMPMPKDLDKECESLFEAMNRLPGLRTEGSCCGHGKEAYRFWFNVESLRSAGLALLVREIDPRYGAPVGWSVYIEETDLPERPLAFILEGPVGAYGEAEALADRLARPSVCTNRWQQMLEESGWLEREF